MILLLHFSETLPSASFIYHSAYLLLIAGQRYAWRVRAVARNDMQQENNGLLQKIAVINLGSGIVMHDTRYYGQQTYDLPYRLSLTAGVYALVLETDAGYRVTKMIVK
ncbi:MAG: hypothetical protein LBU37_03325 [Tannerellaceae bacterium]|jgi:hypothetical protein|nr:hypothetical protein [Tannerellaceae bacterium]